MVGSGVFSVFSRHALRVSFRIAVAASPMNMSRKGQVSGVEKEDIRAKVNFVENLFGIAV
jgi:hypothetical protein